MRLNPDTVKKIAVFRALQLGDMLCIIPAIRALRKAFPDAKMTLISLPWAKNLAERFPQYFDDFKAFPGYPGFPERDFEAKEFTAFLKEIQKERFDLVLQMQGNGCLSNPLVRLLDAKHTAGFYLKGNYCPDDNLFLEYPQGIHEIEKHLKLMNHLGIPAKDTVLEFPLTDEDMETLTAAGLNLENQKYVCVHPGSRNAARQWPVHYFAKLADYCAEKGYVVVLTGTEDELNIIDQVWHNMKYEPVIAAGKTSLGAVAALIKNASALVSNCTGVSHIAAAFGTPSVIISMDGEPERWGPLNKKCHRTVNWLDKADYHVVFNELKQLLSEISEEEHFRYELPVMVKKDLADSF